MPMSGMRELTHFDSFHAFSLAASSVFILFFHSLAPCNFCYFVFILFCTWMPKKNAKCISVLTVSMILKGQFSNEVITLLTVSMIPYKNMTFINVLLLLDLLPAPDQIFWFSWLSMNNLSVSVYVRHLMYICISEYFYENIS